MSTNIEIFEAINKAYFSGDYDAAWALIDPEIVWIEPRGNPDAEVKHGHQGVRESLTKFVGTWTDYRVENLAVVEDGDRLFVHVRISGRGKASGVPTEMDEYQLWTFRDGKAARLEMFTDEAEARRAAGLETTGEVSP